MAGTGATAVPARAARSESVWRGPLVPAALAVTTGIIVDRYWSVPLWFSLLAAIVSLVAWLAVRTSQRPLLGLVYLALAAAGVGAAYHHWHRNVYRADDIGNFATPEIRPARLRGVIVDEPAVNWQVPDDPLRSIPRTDPTQAVLQVSALRDADGWRPVSGRARLIVGGYLTGFHVGDEVEVVGRLTAPHPPANPGEFDYASFLRDQRIRAVMQVQKTSDAVTRLGTGWFWSPMGSLAVLRGLGQRALAQALPAEQTGVATALLLGEGSTMTRDDWDKYIETGVIHVLAISGQHLVVLAAFVWAFLRFVGVRRRRGALGVAVFLLAYALLAGGRPPVLRSAVMVCASCGGMLLRRPALPANSFALGWLTVAALNPTDLFGAGCQLSFLAVAVLYWGIARWPRPAADPLDEAIAATRTPVAQFCRWLVRQVVMSYAITLAIWAAAAPLVAAHYHLMSPVGILIGPPVVWLTSLALLTGFLLLLSALVCWPLIPLFAALTSVCLTACEFLVHAAQRLPAGHWYVGDVPEWWLWIGYIGLFAFLVAEPLRRRWRWLALTALVWVCVGLLCTSSRALPDGVRCTFLAVGHGGCTVVEGPDGRVMLYDAGALGGPDVTRRVIAPFLWHQGIRRLDEVLLSHADLDHFNGLPGLLERFTVGQVTCTPTFADKTAPGVQVTLAAIQAHGVPTRIVRAGDHLAAGELVMEVLHPPAAGPAGNENARSLVLLMRHRAHTVLLTGDLEGPGMDRVLGLPAEPVDVLMAPHHGSRVANTPALAAWAKPRLVVSCQGPPRSPARTPDPYTAAGIPLYGTWPHGAITVTSRSGSLTVATFQTGQRSVLADP
jgi:competence protein ComEC